MSPPEPTVTGPRGYVKRDRLRGVLICAHNSVSLPAPRAVTDRVVAATRRLRTCAPGAPALASSSVGRYDDRMRTVPSVAEMVELRRSLAGDPYRPAYHFIAPAAWMNDPNGPLHWRGRYHVFYQYNPHSPRWEAPYWGHAVSDDLVHWHDLPPALRPQDPYDEAGCFSGTAFLDASGTPTIIYYGNEHGICIAQSRDKDLVEWEKHPANPVIPHPPAGSEYEVYDPCAWLEGDTYYALAGGRRPRRPKHRASDAADTAYLFASHDLERWDYMGLFYEGGHFTEGGEDCAVPQFVPFGDRHMLLFASHLRGAQCYLGEYRDHRFTPQHHRRFAFPPSLKRAGTYNEGYILLEEGGRAPRHILFGRMSEGRYPYADDAAGWSGTFALPLVLSPLPRRGGSAGAAGSGTGDRARTPAVRPRAGGRN